MELKVTIEVWQKGSVYIAKAPELDFVSQGRTFDEAKLNLIEVIKIQFHEMKEMGTLDEYLRECGFVASEDRILPENEVVGFEKSVVSVG
jgi:predicted RNase H-like HicB family nuclease